MHHMHDMSVNLAKFWFPLITLHHSPLILERSFPWEPQPEISDLGTAPQFGSFSPMAQHWAFYFSGSWDQPGLVSETVLRKNRLHASLILLLTTPISSTGCPISDFLYQPTVLLLTCCSGHAPKSFFINHETEVKHRTGFKLSRVEDFYLEKITGKQDSDNMTLLPLKCVSTPTSYDITL